MRFPPGWLADFNGLSFLGTITDTLSYPEPRRKGQQVTKVEQDSSILVFSVLLKS